MNFVQAIDEAVTRKRIARAKWYPGTWVAHVGSRSLLAYSTQADGDKVGDDLVHAVGYDTPINVMPYFVLRMPVGLMMGWVATEADREADDWMTVE